MLKKENLLGQLKKYKYAQHLYVNKNMPIDKACKLSVIIKLLFIELIKIIL